MDFLTDLANHQRQMSRLSETLGRDFSTLFGIVTDREDPEGRGRIKVALPSKGGRFQTDWLDRSVTTDYFSPPVPAVGTTVEVTFRDGDPHKGVYSGVIQNDINPATAPDNFDLSVGNVRLKITPDTLTLHTAEAIVSVLADRIELSVGSTKLEVADGSVAINGRQVATVGARDDDSDILISRGW